MAREVDIDSFAAAWSAGALALDVREPEEYGAGHVPGAWPAPLSGLAAGLPRLPAGREVYVICASGNRSLRAADRLAAAGVDARSVAGGTRGWIGAGRAVVTGSSPGAT